MAARKERSKDVSSIDDETEVVVTEEGIEDKQPTPEETVEALKAQIAQRDADITKERARADAAERERQAADGKVKTAEVDAVTTRENAYAMAIDKTKGDLDTAKRALKEALAGGDPDAVADAQEALTDAKYHLNKITDEQKVFQKWKEGQKTAPVEHRDSRISAKAQEWIDEHPQFNTNKRYRAIAIAADEETRELGYKPDSPAYFNHINKALEEMGFGDNHEPAPRRQAAASSVAAPASHDTVETAKRGRTRTLTAAQVDAASDLGMSVGEYAGWLDKIENEKR